MINEGLFTSTTDLWETPQDFFDKLNQEFKFNTDVCATKENHKCYNYYTKETNGLNQDWTGVCWMNPPYGRDIIKWVAKAYNSNSIVVCLVPARTDTKWWHEYCMKAKEIRLVRGRLKFGESKNSAPFPSAVVVFDNNYKGELKVTAMESKVIS